MVRYDELGERFVSAQDHMTPMLATEKNPALIGAFTHSSPDIFGKELIPQQELRQIVLAESANGPLQKLLHMH
jgi:hypothetical protein